MNQILLFISLSLSLSSVLCIDCSDVEQSKEFGVYLRRDANGGRSYWVYDKNGREWQFFLNKVNRQMKIERFDDKSVSYDKRMVNRFSNYMNQNGERVLQMCYIGINRSSIVYNLTVNDNKPFNLTAELDIENPLIFKGYPSSDDYFVGHLLLAYNRNNKSQRVMIGLNRIEDNKGNYILKIEDDKSLEWKFVTQMNETLFSKIDSIIEYHSVRGLTGYMLWFNVKDRHYYCFQLDGQSLSEQVFYQMNCN